MAKSWSVLLPISISALVLPLVVWDVHLSPARMLSDIGMPFWPYQVPQKLLMFCDAPAVLLARPFQDLFHAYSDLSRDVCILIATPLVWWWIGNRIEHGFLRPPYRAPRLLGVSLLLIGAILATLTILDINSTFRWWQKYSRGYTSLFWVFITNNGGTTAWVCVTLAMCFVLGTRLLRRKDSLPIPTARRDHRITLTAFAVWAAAFALTPVAEALRNYNDADPSRGNLNPDSCISTSTSGCVHGTIQTVNGDPLRGIYLDAVPLTAPANTHPTLKLWTKSDRKGRYSFDDLEPGEYLVGVHVHYAPTVEQPYSTTFYPGVEGRADAAHLPVTADKAITLKPIRLNRLPVTTFTVEVRWSDGSHPSISNLFVNNVAFHGDPKIMREPSPQIDNGVGSFTLPQNFDYEVNASIICDVAFGGQRETRSLPLHVTDHPSPAHLILTLPGEPCNVR